MRPLKAEARARDMEKGPEHLLLQPFSLFVRRFS